MQIEPYIIISDCHNLFFHICPFRKIICFRQILYIFCEIVFSFVKKFYYHLPHQFFKSLSGAKQCIKAQLKYVFFLNLMLTNAHFKPFFRLLEIPNTENRHPKLQADVLIRSSDTIFSSPDQVRSFLPTRLLKASRHVFFPSGLQSSSSSNFSADPADSVCYSIVIQSSSWLFQTKLSQPVLPLLKPQHGFPVFDNNFFG